LPAPRASIGSPGAAAEPPRDALEECIVGIWREVLNQPDVGVTADFFDLGGHSLLAMQAVSMLSRMFGQAITLRAFFEHSSVRSFAESLVATEATPGRTQAVARAVIRLRNMSPEEREQRRRQSSSAAPAPKPIQPQTPQ
jgi:hypothetical protein